METTITKKTMRAAIYIRVSTDDQIRGYGLQVQGEKLRAFVAINDYTLDEKHFYKDEGYSGSLPVEERPGMKKLLEDAKKREFDVVITYRLDRMFRKTRLLLEIVEELEKYKVAFRSMTESFDSTTVTGKGMMSIIAAIAEMERGTIQERTTNGRAASARDGKWVTGVPPYGYDLDKGTKKLLINNEEAKWVKIFFRWIVADRLSLREVQRRANNMKIPIPRRKVSNKKTHNYWHTRTIGRIITNETYTGTAYFRKYKRPFKNLTSVIDESLLREREGWISIKVPPIVSRDLFDACIKQLIKNREFSKRNLKRTYLFSKLIYCGSCGFKLFGGYQPPKKEGYVGTKYYHGWCTKAEVGTSKRCPACDQIAETRLLPIWDQLKEIVKQPKMALEKLAKYNAEKIKKDDTEEKLVQIKKTLASFSNKRQRIALLFSDGELDRDSYKKTLMECRDQEEQLRQDQLRLERQLLTKKEIKEISGIIEMQYKRLTERLDTLTYEEKQEVVRLMVNKVIVYPKKAEAEIELNFNPGNQEVAALTGTLPAPSRARLWDNNAKNGLTTENRVGVREGINHLRDNSVRRTS
ncbi:MAG: recombinase family protein [Patescibacteria group bacterium]|jgi:site-specific DNA recombinase